MGFATSHLLRGVDLWWVLQLEHAPIVIIIIVGVESHLTPLLCIGPLNLFCNFKVLLSNLIPLFANTFHSFHSLSTIYMYLIR